MKTSAQMKRARSAPVSTPTPKTSRTTRSVSRRTSRTASQRISNDEDPTHPTETIDVIDNTEDGEEVVDLTSESADSSVVDLTSNDSVLLVDEGSQTRRSLAAHSYVVSSDEDEDIPPLVRGNNTSAHSSKFSRGTISCPICLDMYSEIQRSGRLAVSTQCGHVFCSQCLRDSLKSSQTCPICRKRLTHRQYHPLYI